VEPHVVGERQAADKLGVEEGAIAGAGGKRFT
jgi:hypothetical protein